MVLCTELVTVEANVPTTSVSMMTPMMMMLYPTTVPSIHNGFSPSGSSVVGRNAEEPSVHVSENMKTFKLINVMLHFTLRRKKRKEDITTDQTK